MTTDKDELLATALSNEAQLWGLARDHDHLRSMWETRIRKESHGLNDNQGKAAAIAQTCAYALAVQMVTLRMANDMVCMLRLYTDIKGS